MPGRGPPRTARAGRRVGNGGGGFTQGGQLAATNATAAGVTIQNTAAVSVGTVNAASGTVVLGATGVAVGTTIEAGIITANTLTGLSNSSVTLNQANVIGNLGPFTTGGDFSLVNAAALTVSGTVNAGSNALSLNTGTSLLTVSN